MTQPVVLITGTSSGIGLAAAIAAARSGHRTIATLRTLGDDGPLREAASEAGRRSRPAGCTGQQCRIRARANHREGLPRRGPAGDGGELLRGGGDEQGGHAPSAILGGKTDHRQQCRGSSGPTFDEAYCAAKFAVEGFMEGLAPVAATVGVTVAIVEPGLSPANS